MFKTQCLFLCLWFVVGSYGSTVPFIEKCLWSDQACLVSSTIKALPYFGKGLPEFGVPPMDPLHMKKVTLTEGGIKVDFTDMLVTGATKCNILKVTRDNAKNLLNIEAECPIIVKGHYVASGNLLGAPVEGDGAFEVNCKLLYLSVDILIAPIVDASGVRYWSVGKAKHSFTAKEKTTFNFENLFNGDEQKAAPVLAIFNENWQEIMQTVAHPIVDEVLDDVVELFNIFFSKVPADQLEL